MARYRKSSSKSYGQRQPKVFVPKGLKGKTKQFYKAVAIRPVGEWSEDLLTHTNTGKVLAVEHFANVTKQLEKAKPKNQTELQEVLKKARLTPQQRFVILYEKSLLGPLSAEELHDYLELFKVCFPKAYKSLYSGKSPSQIVGECMKTDTLLQKQKRKEQKRKEQKRKDD